MQQRTSQRRQTISLGLLVTVLLTSIPALTQELRVAPRLSDTAKARFAALSKRSGNDTLWRQARDQALGRIINPDDYACGPTAFDGWIISKLEVVEDLETFLIIVLDYGALDWTSYYSLFFDQNAADDYIGADGKLTQEMRKRHRDHQRFWDVPTQDILLQGMHGSYLADNTKMVPVVQLLFEVDAAAATEIVDFVQTAIESDLGLGYAHPLFTLNAFANSFQNEPADSPFAGIPDKIVLGDGIMEFLADIGLGANAPDFVHAHEFAHHVQFELGLFDDFEAVPEEELPEFTRRTELMADSLGAYYCAHARGASFQPKRIIEAFRASYLVGDCAFDFPGHHGTPNQRATAAEWGANLAASAQKKGIINPSTQLVDVFDQYLPVLVAPDAP